MVSAPGLTLLFDGDDTLWDNNVHFERAIDAFVDAVAWGPWDRDAVRDELDRVEASNFEHAVGKAAFGRHMGIAAEPIVPAPRLGSALEAIDAILAAMPTTAVTLLDGVAGTLDVLGRHHRLGLVTRGDPAEQWAKIDGSGLRDRFAHIAVVPRKVEATYRELVARWDLDPARTAMIGNSPRSDIRPARAAGLRAVLVTNASTWRLEVVDLDPADDGVAVATRFEDLLGLFTARARLPDPRSPPKCRPAAGGLIHALAW
jgi:putative hydrolase of the HAD superfamily